MTETVCQHVQNYRLMTSRYITQSAKGVSRVVYAIHETAGKKVLTIGLNTCWPKIVDTVSVTLKRPRCQGNPNCRGNHPVENVSQERSICCLTRWTYSTCDLLAKVPLRFSLKRLQIQITGLLALIFVP